MSCARNPEIKQQKEEKWLELIKKLVIFQRALLKTEQPRSAKFEHNKRYCLVKVADLHANVSLRLANRELDLSIFKDLLSQARYIQNYALEQGVLFAKNKKPDADTTPDRRVASSGFYLRRHSSSIHSVASNGVDSVATSITVDPATHPIKIFRR